MIPTIKELIAEQNALFIVASARGRTRVIADITQRNDTLSRALNGWTAMITRVIDLHNNAETSTSIRPFTNLVPESLLLDSKGKDSVTFVDGSRAPNANELRDIAAISFIGGGSAVTYYEGDLIDKMELSGSGVSVDFTIGAQTDADVSVGPVGFYIEARTDLIVESESSREDGSETSVRSGRFFRFSDPDEGDSFDVKVLHFSYCCYSFARSSEIRSSTQLFL